MKTDPSRRSFFVEALSGAAGTWLAVASTGVVSSFIAACTKKEPAAKKERDQPVDKYGGPAMRPEPEATKYGGPMTEPMRPEPMRDEPMDAMAPMDTATKYGGPELAKPPSMDAMKPAGDPRRAGKYGGPMGTGLLQPRPKPRPRAKKYGGPRGRVSKYGGPRRSYSIDLKNQAVKYGGPSTR